MTQERLQHLLNLGLLSESDGALEAMIVNGAFDDAVSQMKWEAKIDEGCWYPPIEKWTAADRAEIVSRVRARCPFAKQGEN